MTQIAHVAVVVPARNEELTIAAMLASVTRARTCLPADVTSSCVVVADACDDRTVTIARRHPGGVRVIEIGDGCVGAARHAGVAAALDAAGGYDSAEIWLASTDADTVVDADWLTAQLALAEHQVIGVAGIVGLRSDTSANVDAALARRFAAYYQLNSDGTHRHVHGANLGFRADAYHGAGGWRPLARSEDHDLWNRLKTVGPVISTTAICVATSSRRHGRATGGFAGDIARLDGTVA